MTTKNDRKRCSMPAEDAFPCARDICRPCGDTEEVCRPENAVEAPCTCEVSCVCETPCPCDDDDQPQPIPDTTCCCKVSMNQALRILCGADLSELVDFNTFFFLTDALSIGGALTTSLLDEGPADNIGAAAGSLERFSPCNCDLLEITGTAYFACPSAPVIALDEVDALSMCALQAVAFQLAAGTDAEDIEQRNRRALRLIRRAIHCVGGDTNACGKCEAHCDCDSCCCDTGLLIELSRRNLSRQASLAAGKLLLRDVTVLGSVGSVLVLWNETARRVYLVCVDTVEVLA